MEKDVKVLADAYPFHATLKLGGAKETTENLNVTSEGKLTIEGTEGPKTLIANIPS